MPSVKLILLALAACLLAGCAKEPPPRPPAYENVQAGIRFHPAKDFAVRESVEEGCLFAVEASKGTDVRFRICVSPPRPEILLTENAFVACENVKLYIEQSLRGIRPTCSLGRAGDLHAFDALYARRLKAERGKVRVQFVNHLFIPAKGKLVQVTASAVGDDDKEAQALFEQNRSALFAMMGSVRIR